MSAKKKSRQKQSQNENFSNVVDIKSRQKKNKVDIKPKGKNQEDYMLKLFDDNLDIVFGIGPAGSGKTMLAVLYAIKCFKEKKTVDRIVVTRPVTSADEDLGYLPGTLEEKMSPWVMPIMSIFQEYFTKEQIDGMLEEGVIEIAPLAYMRGRSFENSFIIFDEAQNATRDQMKMALTRIGEGTRMVVTGDLNQNDLKNQKNGLLDFVERYDKMGSTMIGKTKFSQNDIVRKPVVKEVLQLYGEE